MKVILFGATGMVGQGVQRECLLDPRVTSVLSLVRAPSGTEHPKLRELVHRDFTDFSGVAAEFTGADACFFCLGISSVGVKEPDYRRITYDFTLAAASTFADACPGKTFVYVSGAGTDSTEQGRTMWARVKGATENAVLALPLEAYAMRPGAVQPLHGITSKTRLYRVLYAVMAPLTPLLRRLAPSLITTTEEIGVAMLKIATSGAPKRILEPRDITALARS
ncbi:uncharacterized protein YbjT (DUF2867 family) [Allocatelliglobosispora scoriae]|uniref:Uncharacterized protein YbjT (DUF2867 family) n=1 Tax=Allocatelliglobosispora scoriae TaxID=643052 RepID=A0A841C1I4_9ACTN|nr:NAD(P)H-binding protein [Allocatelliglobosispora scoriae]MBB5873726.1 uncharacterized protein YbjT (DUF2867 family) [Allocatelliglobosispora scoriae]